MRIFTLVLLCIILSNTVLGHPIITAINYDPSGSDGGYEWVELYNPTNESILLTNYSLERGNGANENDWTLIWSNSSFAMQPYTFFSIGEDEVLLADEISELKLQNGPDSLRLNYANQTIETIGWGNHEFSEYYLDKPAVDTSGKMLERNYTLLTSEILFSQSLSNLDDFLPAEYRDVRNQHFSISQLFLPNASQVDVSYVFTIENKAPELYGGDFLEEDISSTGGHQILVGEDSLLSVSLNMTDPNGLDDVSTIGYELHYGLDVFAEGVVDSIWSEQLLLGSIPFSTAYPTGTYTLVVWAIDSQDAQSAKVGFEFTLDSVLGVSVEPNILIFEQNSQNHTVNVSISNTGNIEIQTDFLFQSDVGLDVLYLIDNEYVESFVLAPGESANMTLIVNPTTQLLAGRYTGNFRVIAYENE